MVALAGGAVLIAASLGGFAYSRLALPGPTGSNAVGRQAYVWTDPARPDPAWGAQPRQVGVVVWYPAVPDTGRVAPYVPNLALLDAHFVSTGELSKFEAWGLRFVRGHAREHAELAPAFTAYPMVVLSPGNATNVEFYAAVAEDLASHGYVVVGVNHPHQVTAMVAANDAVIAYAGDRPDLSHAERAAFAAERVAQRVADLRFVVDQLAADPGPLLTGRLDTLRVGVMGHSLGGIAAAELCAEPGPVSACMNLDGIQAGGAFGVGPNPELPTKPFMFVTKEAQQHPALEAMFERAGKGTYRVVIPGAGHDEFADGPSFVPEVWPLGTSARDVLVVSRGFARAFFDVQLRGAEREALRDVDAPTDVYVYGYPLKRLPAQ